MNTLDKILPPEVTYRQFDYWCRQGYLGENLQRSRGTGVPRNLTNEEIDLIKVGCKLVLLGVAPRWAFRYAGRLLRNGESIQISGLQISLAPEKTGDEI